MTGAHAVAVDLLPPIREDSFDRILIAQARVEGLTLLTTGFAVARYPGPVQAVEKRGTRGSGKGGGGRQVVGAGPRFLGKDADGESRPSAIVRARPPCETEAVHREGQGG